LKTDCAYSLPDFEKFKQIDRQAILIGSRRSFA
jgi:hypothetical protein